MKHGVIPTDAEVDQLFAALEALPRETRQQRFERARALAALSLVVDAGLRAREVRELDLWDVVDDGTALVVAHPDVACERTLRLPSRTQELIREFKFMREVWAPVGAEPLFSDQHGRRWDLQRIREVAPSELRHYSALCMQRPRD